MSGFKSERRRQKPMMERKRRARINKSLEELKDVIVDNNGGILPRLDKARILELTVDYLQNRTTKGQTSVGEERYKAGYMRCANEVTSFLHDKVDDGKLTQIVQYLFTLTTNMKHKVTKGNSITSPNSKVSQASNPNGISSRSSNHKLFQSSVSHTTSKGTSCSSSNASATSLKVSSATTTTSACDERNTFDSGTTISSTLRNRRATGTMSIMTTPDDAVMNIGAMGVNATQTCSPSRFAAPFDNVCSLDTNQTVKFSEYINYGSVTKIVSPYRLSNLSSSQQSGNGDKRSNFSDKKPSLSLYPGQENGHCSRFSGKFGRIRRYGSVCSSTASGQSSADADSSEDEAIPMTTSRLLFQPRVSLAGKRSSVAADLYKNGDFDMSDSGDDSNTSDVFCMDSENDTYPVVNKDNIPESCSNQEEPAHLIEAPPLGQEAVHGEVWRPW